jgi:N-dimethylarginine dimethylaminohydrolase
VTRPFPLSIRSEYGELRHVLVSPPSMYRPTRAINERQKREHLWRRPPSVAQLSREHSAVVQAMRSHGVSVMKLTPQETAPYMFNIRDAGFVIADMLFVARMRKQVRRAEPKFLQTRLSQNRFSRVAGGPIEGGDVVVDLPDVFVGVGERTSQGAATSLASQIAGSGLEVHSLRLAPGVLHLDTVFGVLPNEYIVAPTGFANTHEVVKQLRRRRPCISVKAHDVDNMPTNFFALDPDTVIVSANNKLFIEELRARRYLVIPVDMSQHQRIGGSVRCMTLPLYRF